MDIPVFLLAYLIICIVAFVVLRRLFRAEARPEDDPVECPFCGEAGLVHAHFDTYDETPAFRVSCSSRRCINVYTPSYPTRDEAVARWNKRPVPYQEVVTPVWF